MKTARKTPPVFVINLASSIERRVFISAQLEKLGMSYSIVEAVDGSKLTATELPSLYDRERAVRLTGSPMRPLTLPEIGCALSHLSIYKKILEENLLNALVFEDDSLISNDMPDISALLASYFPPKSNSVVLCTHIKYYLRKTLRLYLPSTNSSCLAK
jgi:glycosyl transferase family 25